MNVAIRPASSPAQNILSLCSGVGGLDLGVKLALNHLGIVGRGVAYVEGEAAAAASLVASMEAGWMDQAPIWSDMRTFDARPWRGVVDIVVSGDPCQDNSVAGKGAGADGERFLASEVTRIAEECRPSAIFRENVPGNADGQLEAIIPPLEGMGYRVAAGIFSSSETGNTMRRERLFIMAVRIGEGLPCAGFGAEHCSVGEQSGIVRRAGLGAAMAVADGGSGGDGSIQRSGELGFLAEGDGTRRRDDQAMVQPEGVGPRESWPEHAGQQGRHATAQPSSAVAGAGAGAAGARSQGRQSGQPLGSQRAPAQRGGVALPPAVIPGPTDSRWIDVLDRFPELQPALSEEEAQSHLRRGVDAMAHRVERLRATGNGVDPLAAAYGFLSLYARLSETR